MEKETSDLDGVELQVACISHGRNKPSSGTQGGTSLEARLSQVWNLVSVSCASGRLGAGSEPTGTVPRRRPISRPFRSLGPARQSRKRRKSKDERETKEKQKTERIHVLCDS